VAIADGPDRMASPVWSTIASRSHRGSSSERPRRYTGQELMLDRAWLSSLASSRSDVNAMDPLAKPKFNRSPDSNVLMSQAF